MSDKERVIASVQDWFRGRVRLPDIWEPEGESYFDKEAAAPSLLVDDGDLLFAIFIPASPVRAPSDAAEALRGVTTHLKLLFRSMRDLEMNRLLVGVVYANDEASRLLLSEALAGLSSVDRLHRLVLVDDDSLDDALGPVTHAPVAPFLKPAEPEAIRRAVEDVIADGGSGKCPELSEDLKRFADRMAWGDDGPWPGMANRIKTIVGRGASDV